MPIEIKELHIKAIVSDNKSSPVPEPDFEREKEKIKKEIVKDCVEKVLQVLEEKSER